MKKTVIIFFLGVFTLPIFGQNSRQTKEIKIRYDNIFKIFNICISGCSTTFDKDKTYSWYSEITQDVKETKGGAGGKLLHGNYKSYYKNGDLFQTTNYFLGLEDGTFTQWDEFGNINFIQKQDKGVTIYSYVKPLIKKTNKQI